MIKKWNKTGKIKAIILGVLALPNLLIPFGGQEIYGLEYIFIPFLFACISIPLIIIFNKVLFRLEITKPNWNDNPLSLKYPLSFSHFGASFFIIIGFSIILGTVIKFQTISNIGQSSISLGFGILTGNLIMLNWKKLRTYYLIFGSLGFLILIIYSFMFLIRSYTKNEDIIKHFSQQFDNYTKTAEKIINELDSNTLIENTIYSISIYDESINYTTLKEFIYREETILIPIEKKLIIDALFDTINCSSLNLMKDKYYRFSTDLRNWNLNHICLVKIIDNNVLVDSFKDWEILKKDGFPKENRNWLYHIGGTWYIESKIQVNKNEKEDYPYERDLSTKCTYHKNKNLESIGREFNRKENGITNYLKHGKWLYLDSNEFITKERIYCYDSLILENN